MPLEPEVVIASESDFAPRSPHQVTLPESEDASVTLDDGVATGGKAFGSYDKRDLEPNHSWDQVLADFGRAGYLRAQLKALSKFDRVLGGFCWAIALSGASVDVDLAFDEDQMDIGRRIKLAENVVKALRAMKCPFELQAHQIHGHDLPALEPVIQWLCQGVEISRHRRGKQHERAAELHHEAYKRRFGSVEYSLNDKKGKGTRKSRNVTSRKLSAIKTEHFDRALRPTRRLTIDQRRPQDENIDALEIEHHWVRAVLLEFGERTSGSLIEPATPDQNSKTADMNLPNDSATSSFDTALASESRKAKKEARAEFLRAKSNEEKLLKRATPARPTHRPNLNSSVESISLAQELRNKIQAAQDALSAAEVDRQILEKSYTDAREELNQTRQASEEAHARKRELSKQIKLEAKGREDLKKLSALIGELHIVHEDINASEDERLQLRADLMSQLQLANSTSSCEVLSSGHVDRMRESADRLRERHQHLAREIFLLYQEGDQLSFQIDGAPTEAEMIQYERRLFEVYEQLANKFEENKKHINTYNALEATYQLLTQECELLQSVYDTFQTSMKSRRSKMEFVEKFRNLNRELRAKRDQMHGRLDAALAEQSLKEKVHHDLVCKYRHYHESVSTFQLECERNQMLRSASSVDADL